MSYRPRLAYTLLSVLLATTAQSTNYNCSSIDVDSNVCTVHRNTSIPPRDADTSNIACADTIANCRIACDSANACSANLICPPNGDLCTIDCNSRDACSDATIITNECRRVQLNIYGDTRDLHVTAPNTGGSLHVYIASDVAFEQNHIESVDGTADVTLVCHGDCSQNTIHALNIDGLLNVSCVEHEACERNTIYCARQCNVVCDECVDTTVISNDGFVDAVEWECRTDCSNSSLSDESRNTWLTWKQCPSDLVSEEWLLLDGACPILLGSDGSNTTSSPDDNSATDMQQFTILAFILIGTVVGCLCVIVVTTIICCICWHEHQIKTINVNEMAVHGINGSSNMNGYNGSNGAHYDQVHTAQQIAAHNAIVPTPTASAFSAEPNGQGHLQPFVPLPHEYQATKSHSPEPYAAGGGGGGAVAVGNGNVADGKKRKKQQHEYREPAHQRASIEESDEMEYPDDEQQLMVPQQQQQQQQQQTRRSTGSSSKTKSKDARKRTTSRSSEPNHNAAVSLNTASAAAAMPAGHDNSRGNSGRRKHANSQPTSARAKMVDAYHSNLSNNALVPSPSPHRSSSPNRSPSPNRSHAHSNPHSHQQQQQQQQPHQHPLQPPSPYQAMAGMYDAVPPGQPSPMAVAVSPMYGSSAVSPNAPQQQQQQQQYAMNGNGNHAMMNGGGSGHGNGAAAPMQGHLMPAPVSSKKRKARQTMSYDEDEAKDTLAPLHNDHLAEKFDENGQFDKYHNRAKNKERILQELKAAPSVLSDGTTRTEEMNFVGNNYGEYNPQLQQNSYFKDDYEHAPLYPASETGTVTALSLGNLDSATTATTQPKQDIIAEESEHEYDSDDMAASPATGTSLSSSTAHKKRYQPRNITIIEPLDTATANKVKPKQYGGGGAAAAGGAGTHKTKNNNAQPEDSADYSQSSTQDMTEQTTTSAPQSPDTDDVDDNYSET